MKSVSFAPQGRMQQLQISYLWATFFQHYLHIIIKR